MNGQGRSGSEVRSEDQLQDSGDDQQADDEDDQDGPAENLEHDVGPSIASFVMPPVTR
ncbi:hypothetical protein M5E06_19730 [Azospirillum sp. A1-3]|uniref:hypothetical protein n=1 Tax=Azospirillum sp. A1-3 TaxID=185874 RepID=UPI0020771FF2|nr:hypothetical protein [Azospirillum sp. A1-3]MCM8736369.1 hypothetical protein [Azospirillum sp. A1-3]